MTSRTHPPSDSNEAGAFGPTHGRRHRDDQTKFFTIAEVAERLHVATRTIRRWIKNGDLIAHRHGGVVRISDGDLRAFLAASPGSGVRTSSDSASSMCRPNPP
jgi:excisionase family DNA binding protein